MQLAVERELERLPKVSGAVDVSKIYVTQAVNEVLTHADFHCRRPDLEQCRTTATPPVGKIGDGLSRQCCGAR